MRVFALLVAAFVAMPLAVGQEPPRAAGEVACWSFDADSGSWQSADPAAQPVITTDANILRPETAGGVLEYAYTTRLDQFSGVMTVVESGLAGGRSLRYWLRTDQYALIITAVSEEDGSQYAVGLSSLPDRWQEVALDFSDFQLGEDSTDENGRLDPDQIRSLGLIDMGSMFAQAAMTESFIPAPTLGPRMLWLDDVSVRDAPLESRWQPTEANGAQAFRLDSFERTPLQWLVVAAPNVGVDYDGEHKTDGDFSLRVMYDLPPGKLFGMTTSLPAGPIGNTRRISLALMSEVATSLLIQVKERDGSEYNTFLPVQSADELTTLNIPFADMTLGDESTDENGRLDVDQLRELVIADISLMTDTPVAVNTLWLDDIVFAE